MKSHQDSVSESVFDRSGRAVHRSLGSKVKNTDARSEPTVFVVEDDSSVRKTINWVLEARALRAEVFGSAEEFLDVFDASRPGCVVVDLGLPGIDGVELLEQLKAQGCITPIIVFTGEENANVTTRSLKAGAWGFCSKARGAEALLASVLKAIEADRRNRENSDSRNEFSIRVAALTSREREVLALLADGRRNRDVAAILGISPKTVANYRGSVVRKTGSDSAASLFRQWQMMKRTWTGNAPATDRGTPAGNAPSRADRRGNRR